MDQEISFRPPEVPDFSTNRSMRL